MIESNNLRLWKFILSHLEKKETVILLCVLESHGSSPGRPGFKMAVTSKDMSGSIGGGIMEHKFVELAKEKLKSLTDDPIIRKQHHNKNSKENQSGMICSGTQTIALIPLSNKDVKCIRKIQLALEKNILGVLRIQNGILSFTSDDRINETGFEMNSEEDWIYEEQIGYRNHLYIVGGGHCALAFSKIMSGMDFFIHLFEERKNLNTVEQNSFAQEKIFVNDYCELKDLIPSGENNYVVIMTFGYRTDDTAVRAIINSDFNYLGVLGSASKMEKMLETWRADELPEEKLNKIFTPIGLKINSQTPEEIAISIAAEIIAVKNKT